jgi:hypothetical protein
MRLFPIKRHFACRRQRMVDEEAWGAVINISQITTHEMI